MSLYTEWVDLMKSQTEETFDAFWKEYAAAEKAIYASILSSKGEKLEGKVSELAAKFNCRTVIFEGFLDGVKTSLKDPETLDVEAITEDSEISLDIDLETLLFNMYKQEAEHLYSLPEWELVFDEAKYNEIVKKYKRSKIYIAPAKIGRNDPCPCGSGKKYKNCCGKNK